ncbi:MAG: hypothetical protein IIW77_04460 [Bacteroidaceae bacterium]|nr:hypothetical protein [Bacteroidaceae bacterium]
MKNLRRIQYRKQNEKETAPWQQLNNIDELIWDGRYYIRLGHQNSSIHLPFTLVKNETATLVVEDHSHKGRLQHSRIIVQTMSKADQESGELQTYTRTYHKTGDKHQWGEWKKGATSGDTPGNENKIIWNSNSHVDTYITAGIYNITGERTNAADGLPIANAAPGHSFHARLAVLDSSISGTGQPDDKCITQMLMLSNRTGGDGDVYVRTGRAANKNQLAGGNGWEPWGKLQVNMGVGQVTSLDKFTGNGVYSGVYTNGTTLFETFVMVVINNYAVAGATGKVRSISQFKYALNTDGTFSYKTRTGQGNTGISWGEWVDLGAATTSDIQDNSITAQKLSSDVRKKVENPLRPLYIAAGAEYNDSGADKTKTAPWGETVTHKAGHYYLNGLGDITEEQMMDIYNAPHNALYEQAYAEMQNIRTLLFCGCSSSVGLNSCINALFLNCSNLEVIGNNSGYFYFSSSVSTIKNLFKKCKKLRIVAVHPFYVNNATFDSSVFSECRSLEYIRLDRLHFSLSLADCSNITKDSVLYIIQKALPKNAITITLHPDAYARLKDDTEIVAALEAQPLISLVSA